MRRTPSAATGQHLVYGSQGIELPRSPGFFRASRGRSCRRVLQRLENGIPSQRGISLKHECHCTCNVWSRHAGAGEVVVQATTRVRAAGAAVPWTIRRVGPRRCDVQPGRRDIWFRIVGRVSCYRPTAGRDDDSVLRPAVEARCLRGVIGYSDCARGRSWYGKRGIFRCANFAVGRVHRRQKDRPVISPVNPAMQADRDSTGIGQLEFPVIAAGTLPFFGR